MINKILVANRGEIAIRIMRACRELDVPSVAIYSEADANSLFARYANEAYFIGAAPATESYLNIKKIVAVAIESGADAIHPGYGFLAQNPSFAYECEKQGITFIGPSSSVLELFGNKVAARAAMQEAKIPTVAGSEGAVKNLDEIQEIVAEIGCPVIIKPSGGGGGIGMTVCNDEEQLKAAMENVKLIAQSTFGLSEIYVEKYLPHPRHIEIQVLADSHGTTASVPARPARTCRSAALRWESARFCDSACKIVWSKKRSFESTRAHSSTA